MHLLKVEKSVSKDSLCSTFNRGLTPVLRNVGDLLNLHHADKCASSFSGRYKKYSFHVNMKNILKH